MIEGWIQINGRDNQIVWDDKGNDKKYQKYVSNHRNSSRRIERT
jgi:hypothetical protein